MMEIDGQQKSGPLSGYTEEQDTEQAQSGKEVFILVSDVSFKVQKVVVKSDDEAKKVAEYNAKVSKDHKKTTRARAKTVSWRETDSQIADEGQSVEEKERAGERERYLAELIRHFIYAKTSGREQDIGIRIILHGMKVADYAKERGMKPSTVSSILSRVRKKIRQYAALQDEKKRWPKRKDQRNLIMS